MPSLRDIIAVLEDLVPGRLAEDWDNPGLHVGNPSQGVEKIFVALDPTLESVVRAAQRGAQMLFTHHPLIFRPLVSLDSHTYPGNVIVECIKRDVSVFSAHTNLDIARGGINDMLAGLFHLQDVEVLENRDDPRLVDIGLGRIGYFKEPRPLRKIVEMTKDVLGINHVRVVGHEERDIYKTAVVGGAGGRMAGIASARGADLLITGDVGHHAARDAENLGLALIDAGHFHTEKAAFQAFAERFGGVLRQKGWGVAMEYDDMEKGPSRSE